MLADVIEHTRPRVEENGGYPDADGKSERRPLRPPVHSLRIGDHRSAHEVHFAWPGETLTFRHEALSREAFATGALQAAAWLIGRPPGRLYGLEDLLEGVGNGESP